MIKLKYYRELSGLSQKQLADQMNISQQAVSAYEKGLREPDIESLNKFSKFFNITLDDLIKEKNNNKKILSEINLSGLSTGDIKHLNIMADYLRIKNRYEK